MLVDIRDLLGKAKKGGWAVGAFNTMNLEMTQGILDAAKEMRSPVIIQVTEATLDYAGGRTIFGIVKCLAEHHAPEIPVGVHLDHGKNFEAIKRAVEIGFSSVMYDASRKEYKDNLKETKEVVKYCHQHNVAVQAELGNVPYIHEGDLSQANWDLYMTDPEQAEEFVRETGTDTLAVAIGNAHGFFQEREEPDWKRLEEIRQRVSVPLVLHGASDWEREKASEVIKKGASCFNIDTSLRMAFISSLFGVFKGRTDPSLDPRRAMGEVREAIKQEVMKKIRNLHSWNKA